MNHDVKLTHDWLGDYPLVWQRHIKQCDNMAVLEIGCYEGRATLWFLTHYDCHVTCIDTFEGGHDHRQAGIDFSEVESNFRYNTAPWGDRVAVQVSCSADALVNMQYDGWKFDVILVDGSHLAADVFTDIALSWPLLVSGGTLILDDYAWGTERPLHERPAPAIDAFLTCYHGQYELLERGYQVIVRKL